MQLARRGPGLYVPAVRRVLAWLALAILVCHAALSLYAQALADEFLVPALQSKAQNTGLALARNLTRAMASGVPWEKVEGIQQYFDQTLADNPDLAYIILADNAGKPLVRSGRGGEVLAPEQYVTSVRSVERRYVSYAQVHVGVDRRFISSRMAAARIDGAVIAFASVLLALELAWFALTLRFVAPLRQLAELLGRMGSGDFRYRAGPGVMTEAANAMQARLNQAFFELNRMPAALRRKSLHPAIRQLRVSYRFAEGGFARDLVRDRSIVMRLLAFLFLFGEALSRTFLPSYAAALASLAPLPLPGALAQALPASAAFAGLVLASPMARDWHAQFGALRTYAAGALVAGIGFAACAWVPDYAVLVIARATQGAGFAMMLRACTRIDAHSQERRNANARLAMVAAALLAAETCGPALGGILAEATSARTVFALAAALMLLAVLAALPLLEGRPARMQRAPVVLLPAPPRRADAGHDHMLLLMWTVASGSQRFLFGALFAFAVPSWLILMRHGPAGAGRYFLALGAALALAALFARLRAWRTSSYWLLGLVGCALAIAGSLPFAGQAAYPARQLAGLLLLGFGAVLAGGAQLAIVSRSMRSAMLRRGDIDTPPALVFAEGLAFVAGPLCAAALFTLAGPRKAMVALACLVAAAAALTGLSAYLLSHRSPR
ncbi:MFS transporter [Pseudoduganella sp. GCM10020061]|uniref:MFS transporter n=1 Tax=Pseudoduganella sp. GCM10020061 TaxID=3317345 RepID=UPI0036298B89